MNILLIEDDISDAHYLRRELQKTGVRDLQLNHTETLSDALPLLDSQHFDVVIADLNLPDAVGLDIVERVWEVDNDTPVVVLSGNNNEEFAIQAVQEGVQDYLVKWEGDGRLIMRAIRYAIERKRIESRLHYLTQYDELTGLYNRSQFQAQITKACARAARSGQIMGLAFVDLDRFKLVNDTLGHDAGDALLKQVAERLTTSVRKSDTVARMGGDEFAIILEGIQDKADAEAAVKSIQERLAVPYTITGEKVLATPSIGLTLYPDDGQTQEALLKNADIAMYQAKSAGRNRYQLYTRDMNIHMVSQHTLLNDLRAALKKNQFEVYYQPKVALPNGRILGFESLLRWRHPHKGLVLPGAFIRQAEESGLITPIGHWVLSTVCQQIQHWHAQGLPKIPVSVNVCAREFHRPELADEVQTILTTTGLEARYLELEVTESMLMENTSISQHNLRALKALGLSISMDDFGTGYSSLSFLCSFNIDILKIDRSFVQQLHHGDKHAFIVKAIIGLAQNLKLGVIAEGVETEEQARCLLAWGCTQAQGYLFGKPAPAAQTAALLGQPKHCWIA